MAEAVSRRPLTPQARVLSLISPRDICGGHSSCGTGFSPTGFPLSVSFHQCSTIVFVYMLLLPEGQTGEVW